MTASAEDTKKRLEGHGIKVYGLNEVSELPVYTDGGGALTRAKIVAAVAKQFVRIVNGSKLAPVLGCFPLPIEAIPMARAYVTREFTRPASVAAPRGAPSGSQPR